jgi:hypothetical protein
VMTLPTASSCRRWSNAPNEHFLPLIRDDPRNPWSTAAIPGGGGGTRWAVENVIDQEVWDGMQNDELDKTAMPSEFSRVRAFRVTSPVREGEAPAEPINARTMRARHGRTGNMRLSGSFALPKKHPPGSCDCCVTTCGRLRLTVAPGFFMTRPASFAPSGLSAMNFSGDGLGSGGRGSCRADKCQDDARTARTHRESAAQRELRPPGESCARQLLVSPLALGFDPRLGLSN